MKGTAGTHKEGWHGHPHLEGLFNPVGQQRGGLLLELGRLVPGRGREHPLVRSLSEGAFGTSPVLAGYLTGVLAARLARDSGDTDPMEAESAVHRIRFTLAPLLAGVGDRIFWGALRPVLTLAGLLCVIFQRGDPAIVYLLGYNSIQLYWRRRSWLIGCQGEAAIRDEIRGRKLERWAAMLPRVGRFLLGLTAGVALTGLWNSQGGLICLLWVAVGAAGFGLAAARRFRPLAVGWAGIAAAVLVAWVRFTLGRTGR